MDKRAIAIAFSLVSLACSSCKSAPHRPSDDDVDAGTRSDDSHDAGAAADGGRELANPGKSGAADGSMPGPSTQSDSGAGGHAPEASAAGSGGSAAAGSGGAGGHGGGTAGRAGASSDEDAGVDLGGPPPACGTAVDKLDLLFMVDNSNSMAGEQSALRAQFPRMIDALTSGGVSALDGSTRAPVRDLHVGVVSSDMGIPGVEFGSCHANGGDDGRLQHTPRSVPGLACDASYPAFLGYNSAANTDKAKLAHDVACIASLGTGGCGFEEQLEAPFKALWPSVYVDANGAVVNPNPYQFLAVTDAGKHGRGDVPAAQGGNLGFLRKGSLIAIVLLTDEEDCSVQSTAHLWPTNLLPDDSPYKSEVDINLRCFYHPEFSFDISRYYNGFRMLRAGHEDLVVFSAIVGIPTDLVDLTTLRATDFENSSARDAFYDTILNDPRMQQQVDSTTMPGSGNGNLTPSCSRSVAGEAAPSTAFPPQRIVKLAKAFGANAMLQSICQDDLSPAIDAIVAAIAKRLENRCE